MPKPNKQAAQLKQIRNIKKLNLDNKLNKNLGYASSEKDPDSDKEIDNGFIYETDNSDGEWFNETISEELDDAFTRLISQSMFGKQKEDQKFILVLQQEHFVEIKKSS